MIIIKIFDILLELIYPNICGICKQINKCCLCENCKKRIGSIAINKINTYKNDNSKFFDYHAYIFKYDGEIRQMLLNYKFNEEAYLYKTFARIILNNEKICNFINSYDVIIPVPIHRKRYNERGYNQSELIAKELAGEFKDLELIRDTLVKIKNNSAQSKLKKEDRSLNVRGVYDVLNSKILHNKKVLLLDDIYTTGNTVNECAKTLKINGSKEIGVLTIAKD